MCIQRRVEERRENFQVDLDSQQTIIIFGIHSYFLVKHTESQYTRQSLYNYKDPLREMSLLAVAHKPLGPKSYISLVSSIMKVSVSLT